jgi:HlyD family secretion protein
MLGRVAEVLVRVGDTVEEGALLIRLDDEEQRAKFAAAAPEADARWRERDQQPAVAGREDVRRLEDAVYSAERILTGSRFELENALAAARTGSSGSQRVADARKRLSDARDRLQRERSSLAATQTKAGTPAPSRLESALAIARAEVAAAEALLDKTRIRAPVSGTMLQVNAKLGETVAPGSEQPLVVLGDMSVALVKAELDQRNVAKVKMGQKAFVRSDAFPGRDFEGRVTAIAPSLAPSRIAARGPRTPSDTEVLEVTIEISGSVPLRPGMRVDAFFRPES